MFSFALDGPVERCLRYAYGQASGEDFPDREGAEGWWRHMEGAEGWWRHMQRWLDIAGV